MYSVVGRFGTLVMPLRLPVLLVVMSAVSRDQRHPSQRADHFVQVTIKQRVVSLPAYEVRGHAALDFRLLTDSDSQR
jgi:hypothetical protein